MNVLTKILDAIRKVRTPKSPRVEVTLRPKPATAANPDKIALQTRDLLQKSLHDGGA